MAVEAVLDAMKTSMMKGERIELRGFGVFQVKPRKRGIGRNPRTGKEVKIPPGRTIRFKPGKDLQNLEPVVPARRQRPALEPPLDPPGPPRAVASPSPRRPAGAPGAGLRPPRRRPRLQRRPGSTSLLFVLTAGVDLRALGGARMVGRR